MENNEENVYHNQNFLEVSGELSAQATGTMNLKDVLAEWERKKTENAKKHQEEIKKRVLTQTGKIFADFDNSLKSGILGEIQREEEAAQKRSPRKDRFLEADVTGDIPQNRTKQVSDDTFDVEYKTEQVQHRKEASILLACILHRYSNHFPSHIHHQTPKSLDLSVMGNQHCFPS